MVAPLAALGNRTGILSGISSYKNLSPRSIVALLALCAGLVALGGQGHRFTAIAYVFMICVRIVWL